MTTLPAVEVKVCADCAAGFTRRDNQPDSSWKRTRYCPDCGPRRSRGGHGAPAHAPKPATPFRQPKHLPTDWRTSAACRGHDPELFFSFTSNWRAKPIIEQVEQAKTICAGCPVRAACLEAALVEGDQFAVRGGTTPDERRALKAGAA